MMSAPSSTPIIEFYNVDKRYGSLHVLKSVNLQVQPQEKIALIGPSGCGKSTLLRCIHALETIDSGHINVNGTTLSSKPLKKTDINQFRSKIGMVFQQFNLFPHLSVLENVILAPIKVKKIPKEHAIETAKQWLDRVGILDKCQAYPDQLSGGQQQRVAIARSLAMTPDIILFDEPTSALDPQMSMEVLSVIQDVAEQGITLLLVTHQIQFAEHMAQRIIFMEGGQIIEEGSPSQLIHEPKHIRTQQFLKNLLF
jgi:polar amino acid transport system ATP-binding protein